MPGSMRQTFNLYQSVTDSIVAAIEAGTGPVEMPWHRTGTASGLPQNALTGRRYRGVNVLSLWAAAATRGFTTPLWATYKQWRQLDAQVRRDEKGTVIVFYRQVEVDSPDRDGEDARPETRLIARASWAFNADQVEGWSIPERPAADPMAVMAEAEALVAHTDATIIYAGDDAWYSLIADMIQMPPRETFTGTRTSSPTESFYGVLFHELTHWTGAEHRLDRDLTGRFGSDAYAMEELVAELGAAFLCAELAITPIPRADHAAYVGHWLDVLRTDNRAIFSAASKAAEAADYLLGLPGTAAR